MRIIDPVRQNRLSRKWEVTPTEDVSEYQTFDTYQEAMSCWVEYLKQKYQSKEVTA